MCPSRLCPQVSAGSLALLWDGFPLEVGCILQKIANHTPSGMMMVVIREEVAWEALGQVYEVS